MRRRIPLLRFGVSLVSAVVVAVAACSRDSVPTAPAKHLAAHVPSRAIGTTVSGATLVTDKDDYLPDETLHLSGAGWQAGDTLDIVLDETPQNHPPVSWAIGIGADGTFADSTYVVQQSDAGVTFNITATSRATGETAQATFTDANPGLNVLGSDAAQHGSLASEENLGSVLQGSSLSLTCPRGTGLGVKATGIGNDTQDWAIAYGGTGTDNTALSPAAVSTLSPASGSLSGSNDQACVALSIVTSGLTVKTYHGSLQATGTAIDPGLYFFRFTVTAPTSVATTTTVSSAPDPSVTGQQVTFTATVKNGSTPVTTGTVTFRIGGTSCSDGTVLAANVALDVSGQATATATYNASDSPVSVRACYSGATGFDPSSGTDTQTINNASTTTTVSSAPDPSVTGQQVTFTATVKNGSTPMTTGTVTFRIGSTSCSDGTVLAASVTLDVSGQATATATYNASDSPVSVRACYSGATGFDPSNGTDTQTINKASTTTDLGASPNPSTYGGSVTFTATISVTAPGAGTPTGSVKFYEFAAGGTCASPNGTLLSTQTVSAGSAAFSTNALDAASSPHTITACYGGDSNFSGSDHAVSQVVKPATLTITASSGTKKFGTSYTVTPSYSGFVLGQTETTPGVITTAPTCSSPGSDADATVGGSPYTTSCTGAVAPNYSIKYVDGSLVVTAATTTLTLEAPVPTQYSDKIRLSASVSPTSPFHGQTQSGTVEFFINAVSVGTATLSGDAAAKADIANDRAAGNYAVTAVFTSTNANFSNATTANAIAKIQVITKENASIAAAAGNVGSIPVSQTSVTLAFSISETYPEPNPNPDTYSRAAAGDVNKVTSLTATLSGVASNANYNGTCTAGAVSGSGYGKTKAFSCIFSGSPFQVDAYMVSISVDAGNNYYTGSYDDVLSVYDPNLGFVTGGGKFIDPLDNTRVSFGMSFTYTGKGKTGFRGGWVVVKHHADGGECRVKSNQMNAPAVVGNTATLSGKSNYSCVDAYGQTTASAGNLNALGYVEDNGTSGIAQDMFWINAYGELAMPGSANTASAAVLTGGNIQVPQPQGGK